MPPLFRRPAIFIIPVAIIIVVYLQIALGKQPTGHAVNSTGVHVAQGVVAVLALLLSSPLLRHALKLTIKGVAFLVGIALVLGSIVLMGGRYHLWPSPINPKTHILVENLAFLTCAIGLLIVIVMISGFLRGRFPQALSSGVPTGPVIPEMGGGFEPTKYKTVYNPDPSSFDFKVIPEDQTVDPGDW
jgi:hypothetical protein